MLISSTYRRSTRHVTPTLIFSKRVLSRTGWGMELKFPHSVTQHQHQERNNSTHNCRNAQLVSAQVSFTHTKTHVLSGLDKLRSGGHAAIGVGVGKRLLRGTFRTLIPLSLELFYPNGRWGMSWIHMESRREKYWDLQNMSGKLCRFC